MTNCPSEATLQSIGTGAVGETTFAGLEGHVEQCPACQQILEAATRTVPQMTHPAPARNTPPTLPGLDIERELGRGGTSVVYLAWEPALNRHVAVKLFPRNSLVDPHAREHWVMVSPYLSNITGRSARARALARRSAGALAGTARPCRGDPPRGRDRGMAVARH